MTKEKMHQNAEERLELLHTISDIVGIEVEKRMDAFTDADHFSVRDASRAKPASGTLTTEQDKKERYINNLSPQTIRNKKAGYKLHFINMKKLLLLCALLVSVITLSGAANRSFRTEMEQWNPIGFTQSQAGAQTTNLTAGSAILPTVATAAPSGVLRGGSTNVITFTTSKKIGEKILLYMMYAGDTPTLSGATGIPKSGEWRTYTLTSQTVTIRGDLTELYCFDNQLTTLDVSKNTSLTRLDCSENQLTTLDVSKNTALKGLSCNNNQLKALDVSQNTALTTLYCFNNQLTALDLSRNTELTELYCFDNQLTALDVSKNTALIELDCSENQLTALDVSKNTALTMLSCFNNQLTTLDVSKNTALTRLDCSKNQLTALNVSKNTALTELYCSDNRLTALDLSQNTALETLYCFNNQLTALDVSKNTALTDLDCSHNQLTALDVSQNTALTWLDCSGNQIKGEEMTRLVNSLPDRAGKEAGVFTVVQEPRPEGNRCLKTHVAIAKGKNWNTPKYNSDTNEYVAYEGEEPIPYAVTLTKEGEGTLTATGAADLNAVPEGTELTIEATPAAGYELTALTANGTDILATKKFVVTATTEVKAIFAKTYAVTLTKEGEGTLTATGAADLNAVPEGTELTIEATPAAGYELTALTANGADILATKKVIVKGATEVKATFAKKTAVDVVEAVSVRLYPNPASTYVNVKGAKADALVRLYDANGSLR